MPGTTVAGPVPTVPDRARRFWSLVKTILLFAVLGPPLGAATLIGGLGLVGAAAGEIEGALDVLLFALIYGVPLSYLIGGLPALIVGGLVGAKQAWLGPVRWWLALLIGLAAGVWLTVMGAAPASSTPADGAGGMGQLRVAMLVATCLVPTLICWLVARRWALPAVQTTA